MKFANNRLTNYAIAVSIAVAACPLLAFIPAYPTVVGFGDKAAAPPPSPIANQQSPIGNLSSATTTLSGIPGQTNSLTYTVTRAYDPRGFVTGRTLTVGQTSIPETYTYHPVLPAVASVALPWPSRRGRYSPSSRHIRPPTAWVIKRCLRPFHQSPIINR